MLARMRTKLSFYGYSTKEVQCRLHLNRGSDKLGQTKFLDLHFPDLRLYFLFLYEKVLCTSYKQELS